jgi:hypothetical protein
MTDYDTGMDTWVLRHVCLARPGGEPLVLSCPVCDSGSHLGYWPDTPPTWESMYPTLMHKQGCPMKEDDT